MRVARGLSPKRLARKANLECVSISDRTKANQPRDWLTGKIAGVLERRINELLAEPAEGEQPPANLRPEVSGSEYPVAEQVLWADCGQSSMGKAKPAFTRSITTIVLKPLISWFS